MEHHGTIGISPFCITASSIARNVLPTEIRLAPHSLPPRQDLYPIRSTNSRRNFAAAQAPNTVRGDSCRSWRHRVSKGCAALLGSSNRFRPVTRRIKDSLRPLMIRLRFSQATPSQNFHFGPRAHFGCRLALALAPF